MVVDSTVHMTDRAKLRSWALQNGVTWCRPIEQTVANLRKYTHNHTLPLATLSMLKAAIIQWNKYKEYMRQREPSILRFRPNFLSTVTPDTILPANMPALSSRLSTLDLSYWHDPVAHTSNALANTMASARLHARHTEQRLAAEAFKEATLRSVKRAVKQCKSMPTKFAGDSSWYDYAVSVVFPSLNRLDRIKVNIADCKWSMDEWRSAVASNLVQYILQWLDKAASTDRSTLGALQSYIASTKKVLAEQQQTDRATMNAARLEFRTALTAFASHTVKDAILGACERLLIQGPSTGHSGPVLGQLADWSAEEAQAAEAVDDAEIKAEQRLREAQISLAVVESAQAVILSCELLVRARMRAQPGNASVRVWLTKHGERPPGCFDAYGAATSAAAQYAIDTAMAKEHNTAVDAIVNRAVEESCSASVRYITATRAAVSDILDSEDAMRPTSAAQAASFRPAWRSSNHSVSKALQRAMARVVPASAHQRLVIMATNASTVDVDCSSRPNSSSILTQLSKSKHPMALSVYWDHALYILGKL